jgi:hypothetical protein
MRTALAALFLAAALAGYLTANVLAAGAVLPAVVLIERAYFYPPEGQR